MDEDAVTAAAAAAAAAHGGGGVDAAILAEELRETTLVCGSTAERRTALRLNGSGQGRGVQRAVASGLATPPAWRCRAGGLIKKAEKEPFGMGGGRVAACSESERESRERRQRLARGEDGRRTR